MGVTRKQCTGILSSLHSLPYPPCDSHGSCYMDSVVIESLSFFSTFEPRLQAVPPFAEE